MGSQGDPLLTILGGCRDARSDLKILVGGAQDLFNLSNSGLQNNPLTKRADDR